MSDYIFIKSQMNCIVQRYYHQFFEIAVWNHMYSDTMFINSQTNVWWYVYKVSNELHVKRYYYHFFWNCSMTSYVYGDTMFINSQTNVW